MLAAVSAEADGRDVALGFAARFDGKSAAIAALTEMLQMEFSLASARLLDERDGTWARWRRSVSVTSAPLDAATSMDAICPRWQTPAPDLSRALEKCAQVAIDIWFANIEHYHPIIGTPVYRALSKTLCHFKPRFGRARLMSADRNSSEPSLATLSNQPVLMI